MLYVELPPISETRIKILVEQCFRRWADERDFVHLANAGKYMSAMAAVALKITYTKKSGEGWLIIFFITSSLATIYQVYWDLVIDWGLLCRNSRNKWLRDQLLLDSKWIYFASMVRTHYAALSKLVYTWTLLTVILGKNSIHFLVQYASAGKLICVHVQANNCKKRSKLKEYNLNVET